MNRRQFLRSAGGLAVALPWLSSLARAQNAQIPLRFALFWETGGTINHRSPAHHYDFMHPWDDWRPAGPPEAPVLGPLHEALAPHLDRLLFLSGLDNFAEPGEHQRADLSSLTARSVQSSSVGLPVSSGASIDQVLAERLSARWPVPFSSVDLATPGPTFGEPSQRAAGQPVVREHDPRLAFARLFTHFDAGRPEAELARLRAEHRSVLDGVLGGFQALHPRLSAADRLILEAHQDHLRAMEQRLAVLDDPAVAAACRPPDVSSIAGLGAAEDWLVNEPHFRQLVAPLQADVMAHALVCRLTHVVTMHQPDTIEPFLPLPFEALSPQVDAHALGHSGRGLGDPEGELARAWRAEMQANRRFKVGQVARFLDTLAPLSDEGGPLLDHTLVLHISEFSNAALHSARDLPIMLAGNLGGFFRTGRHLTFSEGGRGPTLESHIDYTTEWSTHNLHTTLLRAFRFEDEHFGDDTCPRRGVLPGV